MKNNLLKILILLAIVTVAGVGGWLYTRYGAMQADAKERLKTETATFIQGKAAGRIRLEDFSGNDPAHQQEVFRKFFEAIQSSGFVRIKVWDKNFTVIWSDLSELIGKRFPNNHEVEEALEGEAELEIEEKKTEHLYEREFHDLAEIYVPILGEDGKVIGVMEVYKSAIPLYVEVGDRFQKLAVRAAAFTLIGYLLVAFIISKKYKK